MIDTNVVVSAMISGRVRPPTQILDAWHERRFNWITSPSLIAELRRAVAYPHVLRLLKWDSARREQFFNMLGVSAVIVEPTVTVTQPLRDPNDAHVLEAAVAGGADYIVTGDKDLIELGRYEGIRIFTPTEFLAVIAAP